MIFKVTHSGIPKDIIYHIECKGLLYIGQSKQGFNRIQSHINEAFRCNNQINENYDATGALKIYNNIRASGLMNTHIEFYSAEENYGLSEEDLNYGLSLYIPANANSKDGDPQKATTNQRRDAAEILHILHYFYKGYNLANVSFGGQSTSGRMRLDDQIVKLLTRQTSPQDAARLISASDTSLRNLFHVFNQTNEFLFTDKWNTIYNSSLAKNIKDPNNLLSLTGPQFVEQYVVSMLVTGLRGGLKISYEGDPKDEKLIRSFFQSKIEYLQQVTPIVGDKKAEPTAAHKKLLNQDSQHLFSATINIDSVMKYVTNALQRGLENLLFSKKGKNLQGTGNISNKKQSLNIVSVTGLFDISKMHVKNNTVSNYIININIPAGHPVDDYLKQQFAFAQFNYIYNKLQKNTFNPNSFYEYSTEDTSVIKYSNDLRGFPVTAMSPKNIPNQNRLINRMKVAVTEKGGSFVNGNGENYFMEMMSIYRQYHQEMQLYEYEDNNGETLFLTRPGLEDNPLLYFNDVYHQDLEVSLQTLTIY